VLAKATKLLMLSNIKEIEMCVFCEIDESLILLQNDYFFVIRDKHPVSRGHLLIISKRHVESYFDLQPDECLALHGISSEAKTRLDQEFQPSGYNLAVNQGRSAGQTVFHFHLHLIPRYG